MKSRQFWIAILFILLTIPSFGSFGQQSYRVTPQEIPLLPPYCQARFAGPPEQARAWEQQFGRANWVHIHHYCNGLNFLNRYHRTYGSAGRQQFHLQRAIAEFNYVIQRWKKDFLLLPVAHLQKGKALSLAGRTGEALTEYQRALEINPQFTVAYGYLSDYYKELGDIERAREVPETGLEKVPGSRVLGLRLENLDKASGG